MRNVKCRDLAKQVRLACAAALLLPCALQAKTDNIDLPFADDPAVIGQWVSVAYVDRIEDFAADAVPEKGLFFRGIKFLPGGGLDAYGTSWTKGVVLHEGNKTASHYTLRRLKGVEYLLMEWKTGDYVLRDMLPGYYVMVREKDYKEPGVTGKAAIALKTYDCLNPGVKPAICRRPAPARFNTEPLAVLPGYDPGSGKNWQLDLRGADISRLDLAGRTTDLLYADFDSRTKFPAALPAGFSPLKIMALGKDPGLGLRALRPGFTGKGVGIGIIDQRLLATHKEYAKALKSYEEMHMYEEDGQAAMHGPAVASIAVGRTCGVAPEAGLYYIATDFKDDLGNLDFKYLGAAIDRLIAISGALPKAERIRVISISRGFRPQDNGAPELLAAIGRAKAAGMMVLTTSPEVYYDFDFMGLGRDPLADPDKNDSYTPGLFWRSQFFSGAMRAKTGLMVPMDSRTTASPTGDDDYVFYRSGGLSWATPYVAGLYALACQADPALTPETFFKKALATSASVRLEKDGREFYLRGVAAPAALLQKPD